MAPPSQLLVIYNADSTIRGKLAYAYRKLSSSSDQGSACAACDITHGGLSLKEVPGWTKTKSEIEKGGLQVLQWHRDEVELDVKNWIREQELRYPVVLIRSGSKGVDGLKTAADFSELAQCAGDATKLVGILEQKGLLQSEQKSTL